MQGRDAIHIIGAGGIGCAVGYALRAAGLPVVFVDQNWLKIEAGSRSGVCVSERSVIRAYFVLFNDWRPRPGTRILLCTKCYDNPAVLERLPTNTVLIPIQNGFDAQLRSTGHQFEGIASFVSECKQDVPHTRITRKGMLHIGRTTSGSTPDTELTTLADALRRSDLFGVKIVSQIEPIKYTKLMYNAAISPIAAAAGIDNGQLLSVPSMRQLFFSLLQENYRILRASKIELGTVGPFHPRTVAWILRQKWLARVMAKFFEPSLRGTYCSMAGEIQKGRTEMENYNGHLIRLAEHASVPCLLNQAVFDLVTRMTAAREHPRRDVLSELPATC